MRARASINLQNIESRRSAASPPPQVKQIEIRAEMESPTTPPSLSPPAKETSPTSIMAPLPASQIGLYTSRTLKKKHSTACGEHGVLQTAGKAYVPHGRPHLWLGRKPLERAELGGLDAEPVPAAADRFALNERHSSWPAPDPTKISGYDCKSRSVLRHFPRDTLKSSEGRIARFKSGHGSMAQLTSSRSSPSLPSHKLALMSAAHAQVSHAYSRADAELEVVLRPAATADVPAVAPTILNGREEVERRTQLEVDQAAAAAAAQEAARVAALPVVHRLTPGARCTPLVGPMPPSSRLVRGAHEDLLHPRTPLACYTPLAFYTALTCNAPHQVQ